MSDFRGVDINQSAQTKPTDQPWLLPSTKEETKKDNSTDRKSTRLNSSH